MVINGVSEKSSSYSYRSTVNAAKKSDSLINKSDNQTESKSKIEKNDPLQEQESIYDKVQENDDEEVVLTEDEVSDMSDKLNEFMEQLNTDIRFQYHESLDRLYMQVVDRSNDEVIKEFPPEKMLEVLEGLHDWVGLILDKEA
jgi:flagellar protein FlaG